MAKRGDHCGCDVDPAGGPVELSDLCARHRAVVTGQPEKRRWSNARETTVDGITFPSRVEARVYQALVAQFGRDRVVRPRALNLWAVAPDDWRVPLSFRPDFAILASGVVFSHRRPTLYVDAKSGKRRSRDWRRGVAAFRASYAEPLYEWDGKGTPPWVVK